MLAILLLDLLLLGLQVQLVVGLVPTSDVRTKRAATEIPCDFWDTKAGLTLIGALITGLALLIIALTAYLLLSFQHNLILEQIRARRNSRSPAPARVPVCNEVRNNLLTASLPDSPPSYNTIIHMDNHVDPTVVLL